MQYANGHCKFAIPLPLNGFDEDRIFQVPIDQKLKQMTDMIKGEDSSVKNISIQPIDAQKTPPFDENMTLNDLIGQDFELQINDHVMLVETPLSIGLAYSSLFQNGLDSRSLAQKIAIRKLKHNLTQLTPRPHISYEVILYRSRLADLIVE